MMTDLQSDIAMSKGNGNHKPLIGPMVRPYVSKCVKTVTQADPIRVWSTRHRVFVLNFTFHNHKKL